MTSLDFPEDLDLVKAIEDTISQVNNWKAKHDAKDARIKELEEKLRLAEEAVEINSRLVDQLRQDNSDLMKDLEEAI